jgi:lysozyme
MSTLSNGSKGAEVRILQRDLCVLGYPVTIDGDFGDNTAAAAGRFQTDQGLVADSIVGPVTWAVLDNLVPQGMDISHHNVDIDWVNLSPHVQFAYCKASQGATFKDDKFQGYLQILQQKQVIPGAYHFLTFQAAAADQLDNFMNCGFDFTIAGTLPPAIDIEWQVGTTQVQTDALNEFIKNNRVACIQLAGDFLQLLAAKTGRTPIVYTARSFMSEYLDNTTAFEAYPLWIASYQTQPPGMPSGWAKETIWQYYGAQDGVINDMDLDLFRGSTDDLKKIALL